MTPPVALAISPPSLTSSPSSTRMPSGHFRAYARTLKDLKDSQRDLHASFAKLAFLLPPPTEPSSTELAGPLGEPLP